LAQNLTILPEGEIDHASEIDYAWPQKYDHKTRKNFAKNFCANAGWISFKPIDPEHHVSQRIAQCLATFNTQYRHQIQP
jgi:hypothetical protein